MNLEKTQKLLREMLNKHRGKFGYVIFTKKDGTKRKMNFRQGVREGISPLKGGQWANGAAKPQNLILVTDIDKEKKKEHSRRSFHIDSVEYLKIGGEIYTKGN